MIKKVIICLVLVAIVFFLFNKKEVPNLNGHWFLKEIVVDGKIVVNDKPQDTLEVMFNSPVKRISILNHTMNLYLLRNHKVIKANISYPDKHTAIIKSKEASFLNSKYTVQIDTVEVKEFGFTNSIDVQAVLKSGSIQIYMTRREVVREHNLRNNKTTYPRGRFGFTGYSN